MQFLLSVREIEQHTPGAGGNNTGGSRSKRFKKGRLVKMISDGLIIACIVCIGLTILAYKMHSLPVVFISSIGYLICGLQIFQQTAEILPLILLLMFAMGQFMFIKGAE